MSKRSQARKRQLYGKDSRGGTNAPVVSQAPHNTVAPVLSGTATVGSTLTSTAGTWTGTPTPTITYQWRTTGNVDIAGATAATFVLTAAQAGKIVDCKVTGTNPAGSESRATNAVSIP